MLKVPTAVDAGEVAAAFAELQDIAAGGLELIAIRALGNVDDARDAVQETLARAVQAIRAGRIPEHVALGAFVHGIARHVIADVHRARLTQRRNASADHRPIPAPGPDALDQLVSAEDRAKVCRALQELSDDDRAVLDACFVDGERLTAVAARLQVPAETIRKRKSRALARLRRLWHGTGGHVSDALTTEGHASAD